MQIIYTTLFLQLILTFILILNLFIEIEKIKIKQEKDNQHLLNNLKNIQNYIQNEK